MVCQHASKRSGTGQVFPSVMDSRSLGDDSYFHKGAFWKKTSKVGSTEAVVHRFNSLPHQENDEDLFFKPWQLTCAFLHLVFPLLNLVEYQQLEFSGQGPSTYCHHHTSFTSNQNLNGMCMFTEWNIKKSFRRIIKKLDCQDSLIP